MNYLVFSDLDGTLLDHDTYDYQAAREGLAILRKRAVPLVLVSSKTLYEMETLHAELNLDAPFIFENGGGIAWHGAAKAPEFLGVAVSLLKGNKEFLETVLGETVHFITDMSIEEIMDRTGLSRERARLSRQRLTSLPFIIPSGRAISLEEIAELNRNLTGKGFSITKGGRFYHFLSATSNKGSAIMRVIDYYREKSDAVTITVGIGDGENDIAMFKAVDIPVAVRRKDGTAIETAMDHIRITNGKGPEGFSEAIKNIIKEEP